MTDYAVYQGDKFIDVGKVKDLSKRLGLTPSALYRALKPTRTDISIRLYKLEDEDD